MGNLVRTLIYDGQVSLTVANTTEIVQTAIERHHLSETSAYVLGKALSALTFMSACLKDDRGEISLALKGDGSYDEIGISGNKLLNIRGFIGNTALEGGANEGAEIAALGENSAITVVRDDGYNRPFVGACALPKDGGIDEGFEEYFRISEQLPTRIKTVVELDKKGNCAFAGFVVLQPLPFTEERVLEEIENVDLGALLSAVKTQGVAECVSQRFTVDKEVWEVREARYQCHCSRDYVLGVLASLGETQMRQIIDEDGSLKVHCHYCNTDYEFMHEDADTLFSKK